VSLRRHHIRGERDVPVGVYTYTEAYLDAR